MDPLPTAALTQLPFKIACESWLESRRPYISPKTFHEYQLNINTLSAFFGEIRLQEVDADLIRTYQRMRMTKCGPFAINHECSVLQQVLKRIGRWAEIRDQYQPLPLPQVKRGKSISDEGRVKFWRIMRANPNWDGMRLCATISINSTASPGEIYQLKLRDADLMKRQFWIGRQGAKNHQRVRLIPINDECHDAFREAFSRARLLGAYEPHHFLFPYRLGGNDYDPARHQVTFRTAWDKAVTEAVRQGMDEMEGMRLVDVGRHSSNTRLLENEKMSEAMYEELAGHDMPTGQKFYHHSRMETKRKLIDSLSAYKKPVQAEKSTTPSDNRELAQSLLALAAKLLNSA